MRASYGKSKPRVLSSSFTRDSAQHLPREKLQYWSGGVLDYLKRSATWWSADTHRAPESRPAAARCRTVVAHCRRAFFLEPPGELSTCSCDRSPPIRRKRRGGACPKTTSRYLRRDPKV